MNARAAIFGGTMLGIALATAQQFELDLIDTDAKKDLSITWKHIDLAADPPTIVFPERKKPVYEREPVGESTFLPLHGSNEVLKVTPYLIDFFFVGDPLEPKHTRDVHYPFERLRLEVGEMNLGSIPGDDWSHLRRLQTDPPVAAFDSLSPEDFGYVAPKVTRAVKISDSLISVIVSRRMSGWEETLSYMAKRDESGSWKLVLLEPVIRGVHHPVKVEGVKHGLGFEALIFPNSIKPPLRPEPIADPLTIPPTVPTPELVPDPSDQ